jgi:pyruvate dehydrogenase E2 component (dihydrolipoamide acetyltransferase)
VVDEQAMEHVLKKTYDVGIAMATEAGLMVPVVRNADRLSVLDIAREIERLAVAARDGKSQREDLGGSSFTVSRSASSVGCRAPIINYPEVGIMGVRHPSAVRSRGPRSWARSGPPFSFDHRIIDGDVARLRSGNHQLPENPIVYSLK